MAGKTHNKYFSRVHVDSKGNPLQLPSVTTILGRVKKSDGLLYWANKVGRELGQTLDEARKPAATAGSIAHEWVEDFIHDRPKRAQPNVDPEIIEKAQASFESFLFWWGNTKITLSKEHQELELISEKHKFGGRLDAIGFDAQGRLCIVDWKTSKDFYGEMKLQLAAYNLLWDEQEEYKNFPLLGGANLCRFNKDDAGFSHHGWPDLQREMGEFIKIRETYDILKRVDSLKG